LGKDAAVSDPAFASMTLQTKGKNYNHTAETAKLVNKFS